MLTLIKTKSAHKNAKRMPALTATGIYILASGTMCLQYKNLLVRKY